MASLFKYFLLTYAVMWVCFFTVALVPIPMASPLGAFLIYLGAFTPGLVAVFFTAYRAGKAGVLALLGRVLLFRVASRWYLFAVSYIAAIKLTVAVIYRLAIGAWPHFGELSWYIMVAGVLTSTPFQAGEEIGWRGYALPRLTERFGLPTASILLGIIWACWHLPQFFIRESDTYGQSFFVYIVQVTALSVAFAWLYAKTKGSLLLTMLLHASVNNTKDIVPSAVPRAANTFTLHASLVAWLTVMLLYVCAAYFLARMPKLELSPA